jgi:hypothetical protein
LRNLIDVHATHKSSSFETTGIVFDSQSDPGGFVIEFHAAKLNQIEALSVHTETALTKAARIAILTDDPPQDSTPKRNHRQQKTREISGSNFKTRVSVR